MPRYTCIESTVTISMLRSWRASSRASHDLPDAVVPTRARCPGPGGPAGEGEEGGVGVGGEAGGGLGPVGGTGDGPYQRATALSPAAGRAYPRERNHTTVLPRR
jgi:hypothetical protein